MYPYTIDIELGITDQARGEVLGGAGKRVRVGTFFWVWGKVVGKGVNRVERGAKMGP